MALLVCAFFCVCKSLLLTTSAAERNEVSLCPLSQRKDYIRSGGSVSFCSPLLLTRTYTPCKLSDFKFNNFSVVFIDQRRSGKPVAVSASYLSLLLLM